MQPDGARASKWFVRGSERSLRDSHFWFASDPIIISDIEGQIVDCNLQAEKSFGYSRGELLKLNIPKIAILQEKDQGHWKKIPPLDTLTAERDCVRKDGSCFPGEVRIRHEVKDGRSLFVAIVRDISMRKKAENKIHVLLGEVQKESEQLQRLIDSISDEIWFTDEKLNVILTNPAARSVFGLARGEIELKDLIRSLEIFRPDGTPRPPSEAPPVRALAGEVVTNLEEIVRVPSTGKVYYRQVNSSPVRDADGRIMGTVSVVRDITEQRKTIEILEQRTEEINEANAALRVLLKQREQDKTEMERAVMDNINKLVIPHLDLLKPSVGATEMNAHLGIIRAALSNITASFSSALSYELGGLSPKEIQIAHMIKEGRRDKEIAKLLNLSHPTIRAHRRNIRKKLGLTGRKINLAVYLSPPKAK